MGHVIDVTERGEEATVLTDTGSGGLLGGKLLHDAPLKTHLRDVERPLYVCHNKSEGVTIEREGDTEQVAPDGDYRALAAVTDVRVLFVVGKADGDVTYSVSLADVVDVGVDDGLVTSTLRVTTEAASYEFPCRGDLDAVAETVDGNAQATVRAYRLFDEARRSLDASDSHLANDQFEAALDAVATADEKLQTARERLGTVSDGALAAFDDDNAETRRRIRDQRRSIYGVYAWTAHAQAKSYWADGEYEKAHDQYETAIDAYRNARDAAGEKPTDTELSEQLYEARGELDELQQAPLANARQVAHGAASIDGPASAAQRWETAIRRYQDVLWLDWGRDERRFDGEPEAVREAIVDAVDNLVTERRAAARACREAARAHQTREACDAARDACRTALAHVDRAQDIVDEIAPNRETGLEDTRAAIEDELAAVPDGPTDTVIQTEDGELDQGEDVAGNEEDAADAADGEVEHAADSASDAENDAADDLAPVADYWTRHGWTIEREDGDLVATTDAPLELRAFVRVADASEETTVEAVENCAEMARFVDADLAVIVTDGDPGPLVHERARDCDVHLQDLRDLGTETSPSPGSLKSA